MSRSQSNPPSNIHCFLRRWISQTWISHQRPFEPWATLAHTQSWRHWPTSMLWASWSSPGRKTNSFVVHVTVSTKTWIMSTFVTLMMLHKSKEVPVAGCIKKPKVSGFSSENIDSDDIEKEDSCPESVQVCKPPPPPLMCLIHFLWKFSYMLREITVPGTSTRKVPTRDVRHNMLHLR